MVRVQNLVAHAIQAEPSILQMCRVSLRTSESGHER